jgi:ATP-dependent Lon protease
MKELVEETKIYNILEILPVLPIKGGVIFPNLISPLVISTTRSAKLVDETLSGDKLVLCVSQKNRDIEEAQPEDLYSVGTVVLISKMLRFPDGMMRLLVQGLKRAKVINFTQKEPYLKAKAETVEENDKKDISVEALMRNVVNLFHQLADMAPYLPEDMTTVVMNIESPGRLADFVASYTNFDIC